MDIDFKITGLLIQNKTAIVSRETLSPLYGGGNKNGRKDAEISELSARARAEMAMVALETKVEFSSFVTLTYPNNYPKDGKSVKKDLNLFLTKMRQRFSGLDYFWFLEFQKRGAPHFHLLTTVEPSRYNCHVVSKCWADTVKTDWALVYNVHKGLYGNRCSLERVKQKDGARRYVLKYALKAYQKTVPKYYKNVGRFWGTSKNVRKSIGQDNIKEVIIFDDSLSEDDKLRIINERCGTNFPEFAPRIVFLRENPVE